MNLSYRGIAYQSSSPAVDMTVTEQSGVFLGNRFKIQSTTAIQRSGGSSLKYRGTHYIA